MYSYLKSSTAVQAETRGGKYITLESECSKVNFHLSVNLQTPGSTASIYT